MPDRKCIIIGSGITGLAASVILASRGCDVTIVEKSPALGPLLRGFQRDGHYYDTGFHLAKGLGKGGPLRGWLKSFRLDLDLDNCIPVQEIACLDGHRYPLPTSADDITKYFPGMEHEYRQFCNAGLSLMKKSPFLAKQSSGEFSPFLIAKKSLKEYFDCLGIRRELRACLETRCMLFGVPPARAAFEDFFLVWGNGHSPSMTIPGGGAALVNAFAKRLDALGVKVQTGEAVVEIRTHAGRITGVETESGKIDGDTVIYTGNPAILGKLIRPGILRPAWFRHLESMEFTPEPYILFGTCGNALPDNHVWYITMGMGHFGMVEDMNPSMCIMTGASGPDGRKPCYLTGITGNQDNTINIENYVFSVIPELHGDWRKSGLISAKSMRRYVYGSNGSVFGYAHTHDCLPVLPITRLNGLFLAGQNIQLPGLLGCITSAAIAAGLIAGVEDVLLEFRKCVEE